MAWSERTSVTDCIELVVVMCTSMLAASHSFACHCEVTAGGRFFGGSISIHNPYYPHCRAAKVLHCSGCGSVTIMGCDEGVEVCEGVDRRVKMPPPSLMTL